MKNKINIYLCDLVHNYSGVGSYMFPLNIGYIASYTNKFFPHEFAIKLFKYPTEFIDEFKRNPADIVGFSHYTWSADLNNKLSAWVKSVSPRTIVIFGGPNINHSLQGYKHFFILYNSVDFYIPYHGEMPFVNFIKEVLNKGMDMQALKSKAIDGVISYDKNVDALIKGQSLPSLKDLDAIPSPYLTGLLDSFFSTSLIPIIETNRGCPYTCTFCTQGVTSHNKLDFFKLERIKEELEYIAGRVKNTNILNFADANFGIVDRDMEIAGYVAMLREKTGYPRKFNTNWAKNQPKIFEIAKILTNCVLIVSLQSLDETVLKNVKRTNIKLNVFKYIADRINAVGGISGTEIILGLPGETKNSHIKTIRQVFDWDISYIICYNALLLEGTEMSLDREKGGFKATTKFRLIDNSYGKYDGIMSFESEEGIRSTETMSEEDILYFRPVHWLIQFLWNYRFYFDLLKYLQSLQVNPLDYILKLIDNIDHVSTPEKIRLIFKEFRQDAENEWFDSIDALRRNYSKPAHFMELEQGQYGKLNGKYIFKVLLEARKDFEKYLYDTAVNYSIACQKKEMVFRDILSFLSASIVDFTSGWDEISERKAVTCSYDIMEWRKSKYKKALDEFYNKEDTIYSFYLPEDQKRSIEMLLKQYAHSNKNLMLRKMSEWMDIKEFFYKAESARTVFYMIKGV